MAVVRSFRAIHPPKEKAHLVNSPPYDVVDYQEALVFSKNPDSFIHVVRSEVDLPEGTDPFDETVYEKAKENFHRMIQNGLLMQDTDESFYIYRQEMNDHVQIGLVACCSVDEYQQGRIKKHEFTRKPKEEDRVKHTLMLEANTGMVFLACADDGSADKILKESIDNREPFFDIVDENDVKHTIFKISEPEQVDKIKRVFDSFPHLYIADGHHRAAAASRAREILKERNPNHTGNEEYNFFMAAVFPHTHLNIMDYNRVVKDLNGLSSKDFLSKIEEQFLVTVAPKVPYKPEHRQEFGMCLEGQWYVLKPKPGTFPADDPVESLDVSILQNNLLEPVLGITDPRSDSRIDFVGGIRGLGALESKIAQGYAVAFSVFPPSMEDLMRVADSGRVMPPKSTWFEPKLRSGLLIHRIT
ncbi:MAG TPA: DUF1015 domain-containing protein [Kosmotogaceae bacterium]|nr:MAG: Uncharacterized protein XE05_0780 [Thermotogales bacterium 46_20]HAA85701.1 DUF1015 domain-containing protein [Kosmotogaceae bacterium]